MNLFRRVKHTIYNKYAKRDIKLVVISDIHYTRNFSPKILLHLITKISSLNPDYIAIVGDTINSVDVLEDKKTKADFINFINSLAKINKVIISIGNHDFCTINGKKWSYKWEDDFWKSLSLIPNIIILDNSIYQDDNILITGITQPFDFYYKDKREYLPALIDILESKKELSLNDSIPLPKICMIHSPLRLMDNDIKSYFNNYDIFLSGHMHEGMVPPIIDDLINTNYGLIAPYKFLFPRNARGTIKTNDEKYIIISGGITKIPVEHSKILYLGNIFYPMSLENITITSDKNKSTYKRSVKYEK